MNETLAGGIECGHRLLDLINQAREALPEDSNENGRLVWLTVAAMHYPTCLSIQAPSRQIPLFLDRLGDLGVRASISDLQLWVQKRGSKRLLDCEQIDGGIIDHDLHVEDLINEYDHLGVPRPLCKWDTARGHKSLYVFEASCGVEQFGRIMRRLSLPWRGVDPRSWEIGTAQRLPKSLKTTSRGVILTDSEAQLLNPMPLPLATGRGLPFRLAELLGSREGLTPFMRTRIEEFLENLGIPAPATEGRALFDRCPACQQHDTKACYVNRRHDGSISVYCLGGHEGEGPRSWSEQDLFFLAEGARP